MDYYQSITFAVCMIFVSIVFGIWLSIKLELFDALKKFFTGLFIAVVWIIKAPFRFIGLLIEAIGYEMDKNWKFLIIMLLIGIIIML